MLLTPGLSLNSFDADHSKAAVLLQLQFILFILFSIKLFSVMWFCVIIWYLGRAVSMLCLFLGPVVQSIVRLTSLLRVISLTVLADSIHNILIFFAEKCKSYSHFFRKIFQHICVSLDYSFNKSLTNDTVSFEQLGPGYCQIHTLCLKS